MTVSTEHKVAFNISSLKSTFKEHKSLSQALRETSKLQTKVRSLLSKHRSYVIQKSENHKYKNAPIMNKECKTEKVYNKCLGMIIIKHLQKRHKNVSIKLSQPLG